MNARRTARSVRSRRARTYSDVSARGPISPRALFLRVLCGGPVVVILVSFIFGVVLQAFSLVGTARNGGILGGAAGLALTVLIAAVLCVPGYILAVIWYSIRTRPNAYDMEALQGKAMTIPLIALCMAWVPAVVIPSLSLGVRLQVAGLNVVLMLVFGYAWISVVRILVGWFARNGAVQHTSTEQAGSRG